MARRMDRREPDIVPEIDHVAFFEAALVNSATRCESAVLGYA